MLFYSKPRFFPKSVLASAFLSIAGVLAYPGYNFILNEAIAGKDDNMMRIAVSLFLGLFFQIAMALNSIEQDIVSEVEAAKAEQLSFIKQTVDVNSGTLNLQGVRRVGAIYQREFKALGFKTQWIEMPPSMNRAGHLFAYHHGNGKRKILLIGHLDTVFAKDSKFKRFRHQGGYAKGPGSVDMKGGNAVMLFALKALAQSQQLENADIVVALMGDEESSGSPQEIARQDLKKAALGSIAALGFEGAKDLHSVVTARRGIAIWKLDVRARAGHSSLIFTPKYAKGAILSMVVLLDDMIKLAKQFRDLTFNPGFIAGGRQLSFTQNPSRIHIKSKNNVISRQAKATGEVRYLYDKDLDGFTHTMQNKAQALTKPIAADFYLVDGKGKPAMQPSARNIALYERLKKINQALKLGPLRMENPRFRGAADISYVAQYTAALDGLGAIGKHEHSEQETLNIVKTQSATKRAALLIYQLSNVQ